MGSLGEKTDRQHWEDAWQPEIRMRLPSGLNSAIGGLQRLLKRHVSPGKKFLEIGCAPGKMLAWTAAVLKAEVAGLDYSERGIASSRQLFRELGLAADLRCEDVFQTSFEAGAFDVVYSAGVIEHFDNPKDIVRRHIELLKPGGTALITIPNYGGIYGRLQRKLNEENLLIHNLEIMNCEALAALAPPDLTREVKTYPYGRVSVAMLSIDKRAPGIIAKAMTHAVNVLALLQPWDLRSVSPMLVMEIQRS